MTCIRPHLQQQNSDFSTCAHVSTTRPKSVSWLSHADAPPNPRHSVPSHVRHVRTPHTKETRTPLMSCPRHDIQNPCDSHHNEKVAVLKTTKVPTKTLTHLVGPTSLHPAKQLDAFSWFRLCHIVASRISSDAQKRSSGNNGRITPVCACVGRRSQNHVSGLMAWNAVARVGQC